MIDLKSESTSIPPTPYAPSDSISAFALRLFENAADDPAEDGGTVSIADSGTLIRIEDASSEHDGRRAAAPILGAAATDNATGSRPASPRRARGQRTGTSGRSSGTAAARPRKQRSASEAAIPSLAEELTRRFGELPVGHVMATGASDADEPTLGYGLMTEEFNGRTRRYRGTADSDRQDVSSLIDGDALPTWLRGTPGAASAAARRGSQEADAEPSISEADAVRTASLAANERRDDSKDDLPTAGGLSAADLLEQLPPPSELGVREAPASAPRREMTANDRAAAEEENEGMLLGLIGQLENQWHSLNSPSSRVPLERRGNLIRAFARDLTGIENGEMRAIMNSGSWDAMQHDIAAMLHTEERYDKADDLIRDQLGVGLDEFIALSIKTMEGDFHRRQRYAAGLSIQTVIYSYLNWYDFKLPTSAHLTDAFAAMFGDRDQPIARPVGQDERTIVSRLLNTSIGRQAQSWWAGLNQLAESFFAGEETEAPSDSAAHQRVAPAYAPRRVQPSTSNPTIRGAATPRPQHRPAGLHPVQASYTRSPATPLTARHAASQAAQVGPNHQPKNDRADGGFPEWLR